MWIYMHIYAPISDPPFMLTKDQEGCNDPINPLSPHHGAWPIVVQEALRSTMKEADAPHLWRIFCKLSIHPQPFLVWLSPFPLQYPSVQILITAPKFLMHSAENMSLQSICAIPVFFRSIENTSSALVLPQLILRKCLWCKIQMMFPNALYFQINPNK